MSSLRRLPIMGMYLPVYRYSEKLRSLDFRNPTNFLENFCDSQTCALVTLTNKTRHPLTHQLRSTEHWVAAAAAAEQWPGHQETKRFQKRGLGLPATCTSPRQPSTCRLRARPLCRQKAPCGWFQRRENCVNTTFKPRLHHYCAS